MKSIAAGVAAFLTVWFIPLSAEARIIDETEVTQTETGYEIRISFTQALRYQSHQPALKGDTLSVLLSPSNPRLLDDPDILADLEERVSLSWDRSLHVPLTEITYEGGAASAPNITFRFSEIVEFDVRTSRDLRSLIVTIRTAVPPPAPKPDRKVEVTDADQELKALYNVQVADPEIQTLFDIAVEAIQQQNYAHAIQVYTKIVDTTEGDARRWALELLGLSREKNGQLAHAKSEYERFLKEYPDSPETPRVQQRLQGILTAHLTPHEKLRPAKRRSTDSGWSSSAYGSFAQSYFRDETTPDNEATQINRNNLVTDTDFVGRVSNKSMRLETRFVGSYDKDLRDSSQNPEDQSRISTLTVEAEATALGLRALIGRQTLSSEGVFGRFDGMRAEFDAGPNFRVSAHYGYNVESTKQDYINQDRTTVGAAVNFGPYQNGWDINAYFVETKNFDVIDRRAVGGEIRFSDADRSLFNIVELDTSLFTLLDYDIYYDDLNIFMFVGNWSLSTKTSFNLVLDYRNNPLLSTTTATQSQGVTDLQELFGLYTLEEIEALAMDRTAKSRAVTFGVTQRFSDRWQASGEVSVFKTDGTPASGGVLETLPTGPDYYYSLQLIGNDLLMDNDVAIFGLRLADTEQYQSYSINLNSRLPLTPKFRINPKLLVSYRSNKANNDDRTIIRPLMRMDYRVRRNVRLELEFGGEWVDESVGGISQKSTGTFLYAGYRYEF